MPRPTRSLRSRSSTKGSFGLALGRLEEAAPHGEVLDELRAHLTAGVDLLDGGTDALGDIGQAVTVEVEESYGVLTQHQSKLVVRHALEGVPQPITSVGPGALRMREVAAEENGLDSDLLAHLDLGLVDEGGAGHTVAAPVLTRLTFGRKAATVLVVDPVKVA